MKVLILILTNIVLVIIALLTINYSYGHYGDGGCDGGLCGLAVFFHGLPLILVWILEIMAFNLSLKRRWETFLFLTIALVINTLVYNKHYGYGREELSLEPEILYFFAALCLSIYTWNDFRAITDKDDKLFNEKRQIENIHPVLYSAFVLWLVCHLFSYIQLMQTNHMQTLLIELLFIISPIILLIFIYKKHLWAFYLFFALLIYRIGTIMYFNSKNVVQFIPLVLIISNLYLFLGITVQYFRLKKGNFNSDN